MLGSDQEYIERILLRLEEMGCPFPQFKFYKENHHLRILGVGSCSVVYEMMDKDNPDRHYAMKVMGFERTVIDSENFWNTFRIQRILCDSSPYIMRILAAKELTVETDGLKLQFVLMGKLDGIVQKDKFGNTELQNLSLSTEEEVISFAKQIGSAVMLAHENNVLHRDIKLENIFWDKKEECYKLGDFGMAKYVERGNAQTVVYTDGYGAPEIECRLYDHYDVTADVYSFGITLYLLLNELKFPGSEGYYVNLVQYDPRFTFPAPLHASEGMTRLIRKLCSYRKEERYQTMSDVLEDLNHLGEKENALEEDITFSDRETETYREEKQTQTKTEDVGSDMERLIEAYKERQKTRAGRKLIEKENKEAYVRTSIWYFVLFSICFLLLFQGLQRDVSDIFGWQFWIFPIAVLIEGILEYMREFHIVFGLFTIGIGLYSIMAVGLTVPHVFLIACLIFNVPVLTLAGAVGTGLWMLLEITENLTWLHFLSSQSWIVLIVFLIALRGVLKLRMEHGTTTVFCAFVSSFLYDKIAIGMMIAGIVLLFMQHAGKIVIPEVINQLHLIRTGAVSLVIYIFLGGFDDGEEPIDYGNLDKGSN